MSKILDRDEQYIVTIYEDDVKESIQKGEEVTFDETMDKLIYSITNCLINEDIDHPDKYILMIKLNGHENWIYSSIGENIDDIDKIIEEHIKEQQSDVIEFLAWSINVDILPREECFKLLQDFFYHNFVHGSTMKELAMFDFTTDIKTRGYMLRPWTDQLKG